ncbi:MAG TPA: YfiR family protein [Acetobacteraceae bacterium]|nr:YfiR family protein [Acetobacteraceae bacterium]
MPHGRIMHGHAHEPARRSLWTAILGVLAVLWSARALGQTQLENEIKATYLYKIAQFVEWPRESFAASQFTLCVVGTSPFGNLLAQAVANQKVAQLPIAVRSYRTITGDPGCQLMYVTGSPGQSVANVLALVAGKPVLTVTDGQTAPNAIGVVNFVLADGRVRFEIDRQEAIKDRLAISSKLLSVAMRVLE